MEMDLKKILEKFFKEQVSDEALTEISTLFEAALNEKVKEAIVAKETELDESNKAEMAKFKSALVDKLSEYAKVAVDEFIAENRPAIETECKVAISENVMQGLVAVLKEQYVIVPEGETNVVADLEAKQKTTEGKLNESINDGIDDKKQILEYEKALTFKRLMAEADMTDVDAEKVLDLLDGIEADNVDVFEEKTKIIITKVKEDAGDGDNGDLNKNLDDLNETVVDEDLENLDEGNKSEIDCYLP
jgi:hypothetical protein